jgi:hypothetical protein
MAVEEMSLKKKKKKKKKQKQKKKKTRKQGDINYAQKRQERPQACWAGRGETEGRRMLWKKRGGCWRCHSCSR